MVELQISCFGVFKVVLGGTPLTAFQTDKTRALLAYLAINGAVQQRTALVQFLWPGYSKESAQNSFRQTLHQLRQLLADAETEPPWLLLTRQTVQINPAAPIRVDVLTFQQLLAACKAHAHPELAGCASCLAQLRQAVDLYHGDFLAELAVVESDPFEEWRRITQEQLHIQMLDAVAQLAAAAEAAGDDEQALQDARRQLALEPWLEDAHRRIMRLLARRGQSVAAIAQYNRCRQVLAEELGAEPDAETTALYEQIRSGQLAVTRATERVAPALQPSTKPAETVKAPAWPVLLTPLLGRTAELTQMATLLAQPTCRLVTLVGPPGVGKTRLAQAIGDLREGALGALADAPTAADGANPLKSKIQTLKFTHGLYFIDLGALRDPTLLAVTIAQALAAPENGLQLTGDRLIERLRDKELLLVLDNFEQVLPGVALLNQLLAQCPHLKLLITSRVPLRMPDEQVVVVSPLPLPDLAQPITPATVAQNVAVQLFCQRAALVVPGFTLTESLAPVVAEICRRLDGLPLAIELAAARSRLLPPPALLERLTHRLPARLELLTSGSQVLPPRQQTLRAAIAWSYDLLDANEQRLFRQLTVFAGGATLAAIEAVLGDEAKAQAGTPRQPQFSLFAGIESLLDKSLLRQQDLPHTWPDVEPRVMMLETIREYGWELLTVTDAAASGGGPGTQQRHAEYFLAFAETAAPQLHGATQVAWLDRLALDHDNLRAALDWFVQAGGIGKALRLATALRYFWRVRGHYRDGCERLLQILARPEAASVGGPTDAVRARALNAAGYLQWVQGKRAAAQALLQEALTLGRAVPDAAATAFALRYLGLAAAAQQDNTTAQCLLQESLAIYRTLDHANETALALMYLGDAAFAQQMYDEAQRLYEESAALLRALGNQIVLPYALRHLGYLALVRGDLQAALGLCTESLRLNWAAGEQQGCAAALVALAAVAVAAKQWEQAARLFACVTAWLAASQAQLLPFDRTHYEQTQQRLQQQPAASGSLANAEAPLTLEEALTYVLQEFTFVASPETSESGRAGRQAQGEEKAAVDLGAPAASPPAKLAEPAVPFVQNLPLFPTPLVGRTQALAELSAQLQTPNVRLLTLVGPGGMGKTRLGVEAGRERLATFADGVFFVPLAPISGGPSVADALAPAIANALGITLQGSDPQSTLCQMLSQKQLLLLLDNFEQLLVAETNATDLVVKLINAAPGVQIIVTSRERLKLRDEHIYTVPPLPFSTTATLAEANASAAVRLFVQSVQRTQSNFQLTAATLPAVLRICQAVQGMPLGLELAAANARSAPLTVIADALEQSAEVLSVDWRDLPERQRSMRAVFGWSWQLLSAEEQRILRQCAVFRGGFTYAAVQAVTGATFPLLTRLVDKSLLQWQVTATSEGRYTFHELLRQFAAEQLAAMPAEQEAVAARHSEFYLNYLAAREMRLTRTEPRAAAAEIQEELDNIRQAWQSAGQHRDFSALQHSAWAFFSFCRHIGALTEALQAFKLMVDQTLVLIPPNDLALRQPHDPPPSRLVAIYAHLLGLQSKLNEAIVVAQQALVLAQAEETTDAAALSYFTWGQALRLQGQLAAAQPHLEQTLRLASATAPATKSELLYDIECLAGIWLGAVAADQGRYHQAREQMERSLQLAQTLGKRRLEMTSLINMADIARRMGAYPSARQEYEDGLRLTREVGFRWGEGSSQLELGEVARLQGEYSRAVLLMEGALSILQEIGAHDKKAVALTWLGYLYAYLGDRTTAEAWLTRYQQFADEAQGWEPVIEHLQARMVLALHRGELAQALAYATEGWQIGQTHGLPDMQAYALIGLGHAQSQLGMLAAAATAYQQAFALYMVIQRPDLAAEAQAGLAAIAQQQGDQRQALDQIEAVLAQLAKEPISGQDEPFFLYLTCYQVLATAQDARALAIVQQGYTLLQRYAEQITDDALRRSFLENVPVHRALQQAYMAAQSPKTTALLVVEAEPQDRVKAVAQPVIVQTAVPPSVPPAPLTLLLDWDEMPAVDFFAGRSTEMAQLTAWLTPEHLPGAPDKKPAHLISVLGIGGIGKTTLVAAVTKAVAPNFAVVIWRSLLNAPPLNELLRNWLQVLSRQTLTALPDTLDEQLRLLLGYLGQARCLLVLDNVESLFTSGAADGRAGVMRPGYEGYDQLLLRLATSDHQSCLLLTSREQPYALLRSARQAQTTGRIQVLPLVGLDQQAGQALLQSNGLHASTAEATQLVENYSGNPLALQIVAATIADFFAGDIVAFQQEEGQLFDGMRLVLDQQFARLSGLEREILLWLAIEREPVTVPMLRADLVQPLTTGNLLEALQALQHRSLLEKRETGLTLQNVIIEYTTEYLVKEVCRELTNAKATLVDAVAQSFLNRFALLKAQSKEYTRQSQERLILQPVAVHWQKSWGQKPENKPGQPFLDALRQQSVQHGYAAGNLLNLLLHLGVDLKGYDFSQLSVWQADLRRSVARNVNLAQADLANSAFIQTFSRIENVAISPDGQLLAAAGDGGAIRLFRLPNGEPDQLLTGHTNTVTSVNFSPDGAYLASTGDDGLVLLWAIQGGQLHRQLGEHLGMRVVTFSPDGKLLAGASRSGTLLLWEVASGHLLGTLPLHSQRVNALAFHPNGNLLASASSDGAIYLLNVSNALQDEALRSGEGAAVHDPQSVRRHVRTLIADPQARFFTVTFSPDGQRMVAGSEDGKLYGWRAPFDAVTHQALGHRGAIRTVAFCTDSRFFFSGGYDGAIRLWYSQDMRCCQTLSGHKETVYSLALGRQDQLMASGSEDATLCLWEINPQMQSILRQRLHGYPQALECVAWSGCGRWLATGDIHGSVRLWDLQHATPRCTQEIVGESTVISLNFTRDGQRLVIGRYADPKGIQIWEVKADSQWYLPGGQTTPLSGVACFSPDASLLATCANDGNLRLWNTQPLAERAGPRLFSGHSAYVNRMTFTATGRTLATCSNDLSVRLWQIDTGEETQRFPGFGNNTCLAVNPQGTLLACSAPNFAIALWNIADPAPKQALCHLIGHTNEAFACAFSPDGQLLVSAGLDRSVRLWDVQTGTQRALLGYHEQYALDVAFSPNGQQVASIGKEGALYIWQLDPCKRLHQLRAPGPYAGMNITGVTGISEAQKVALKALGAVEESAIDELSGKALASGTAINDKAPSDTAINDQVTLPTSVTEAPHHPVTPPTLLDWAEMPTVDFFVERTAEVAQLTAWLTPAPDGSVPAQLISILGMGGMGKTTLAAAVTKAVAPSFAVVIWRSLLNAPPLNELLRNWLQVLSRQSLTTAPDALDEQLRLLLTYLQQERCLLVLDNVESIFVADPPSDQPQSRAGVTRPGYEGYDQLFQRLASSEHQSCLLLTSREQPYALLRPGRQVQTAGGRIRILALSGLDQAAGQTLLESNGLHTTAAEAAQLVENYSGNPLALQIVAATIADFFAGDVAAFQREEGQLFDGMRLVLDQQFARLSELERDILVWLAIEREPITVATLRSNLVQPRPEAGAIGARTTQLLEALQALQNRSLLEKHDAGLRLQNVIIEYTTNYLIEQVCQEIDDLRKSVPDTELVNRQSKIANSLLNRFALLKAQAKEYVRQSQARLIVQPLIARLLVRLGKAELVSGLQRIIAQLQTEPTHGAGYAAGNILNLLVQLGVELQGYDFSRLTIRQAYLQGTALSAVSLARAELQQCVFTTAFGAVLSLTLSPDDQLLATATNDWMARVWRLSDGQLYQSYEGHTNVVRSVAFSPDGRWLATASLDQTVRLWEVATGQLMRVLKGHTAGVYSAVFCQGGSVLASAGRDGVVRLWDVNTGQLLGALHGHTDRIYRLAVDPSGALLASGGADQTVRLWDLATGHCVTVFQEHMQGVSCLAFSPNGAMLASGGAGQQVRLWDVATGQTRQILRGHEHWLRDIAFSPDGALLASASADHTVRLWDTASGQARGLLQGHMNAVWALAFSVDGNRLVSGGVDHQLRVWDVRNPADSRAINVVQAHVGAVLAVAVSPDGQMLATGDQHKLVRLWAVDSGQQLCTLSGHTAPVKSVVFSPDGRYLVSTGDDGAVRLWDVAQRCALKTLGNHPNHANRVAYHPRGEFVASSGHKDVVRVWDLRPQGGGRLLHSLMPPQAGRTPSAFGVAFSPDGCYVASVHGGDTVYVWDVASGQCLHTLSSQGTELEWLAWSPNGATLAGADTRGAIHLWDVRMRPHSPIRHVLDAGAYPWDLAFSPDSCLLASVAEDPVVRLWDVESGVCVQMLSGHTQNVSSAVFLPDRKTLVSSGYDSTLRFWNVQTGELLNTLRVPGPYAGLNITGVTGISEAQKAALRTLGAVEE